MRPPIYDPYRRRLGSFGRRWQATIAPLPRWQNYWRFAWEAVWLATVVIVAAQLF
jgi:hypothetical protein